MSDSVKVEGLDALMRALDALPIELERKVVRQGLRAAAKVTEAAVEAAAPQGKTRKLVGSVRVRSMSNRGNPKALVTVGPRRGSKGDGWYARLVVHGTKPHIIRPLRDKASGKFTGGARAALLINGAFRETVHHPGAKANDFVDRAAFGSVSAAGNAFREYCEQRIPVVARQMAGGQFK